jgi:putative flippase GtrA
MRRFSEAMPRFVAIGAIGFVADAGVLTLLAQELGFDVYASRACSFAVASPLTWWLNRVWSFGTGGRNRGREYVRYVAVQVVGALINLGVFTLLVARYAWMAALPVLPLAIGAAVAMLFNFAGCRHLVFAPAQRPGPAAHD